MGKRNYLIEGVSGAGKTAVCTELQRRGYQAIHGDRELVYRGDPETGRKRQPMAAYRIGGLENTLLQPGESGLMSMIG
jgi:predicted ATPase